MISNTTILAVLHHLFVFSFISILFGEYAILKFPIDRKKVGFLIKLNCWSIGLLLGAVIFGLGRVYYGEKSQVYYFDNYFFWIKIISIGILFIYSILLLRLLQSLKSSHGYEKYLTSADLAKKAYRIVFIQMHIFPIPIIAAVIMAKGY